MCTRVILALAAAGNRIPPATRFEKREIHVVTLKSTSLLRAESSEQFLKFVSAHGNIEKHVSRWKNHISGNIAKKKSRVVISPGDKSAKFDLVF